MYIYNGFGDVSVCVCVSKHVWFNIYFFYFLSNKTSARQCLNFQAHVLENQVTISHSHTQLLLNFYMDSERKGERERESK